MSLPVYLENQKVLCYHGEFLYEAKIVKSYLISDSNSEQSYLIHYNGWNKTWDEWVPTSRLMLYTDNNLIKQKQLIENYDHRQQNLDKPKFRRKKTLPISTIPDTSASLVNSNVMGSSKSISNVQMTSVFHNHSSLTNNEIDVGLNLPNDRPNKRTMRQSKIFDDHTSLCKKVRKLRYVTVTEEMYSQKCLIAFNIPTELKLCLVDDHDLINRQQYLISIPKRITVEDIFKKYIDYISIQDGESNSGKIEQFCLGIQEYFDISLGMELLYRFERPQYVQILSDNPSTLMSSIYGIEHLLRLFVKLSELLGYTKLDGSSVDILELHICDLLSFLEVNITTFQSDYAPVTQEYIRRFASS